MEFNKDILVLFFMDRPNLEDSRVLTRYLVTKMVDALNEFT